jgi:hypothetical protein
MNNIYIVKIQEGLLDYIITILTPHLYEGLHSIYKDAKRVSLPEDVLKNFQIFVADIKNWKEEIIINEMKRILLELNLEQESFLTTIKTLLKYTIHIYSIGENRFEIDYENVIIEKFIHDIYINISKELYLNPFLMYDNMAINDMKQNATIINEIIKNAIKERIYKYLPIKNITTELLNLDLTTIQKGGSNTESTKLLTDSINMSDNLRNIINQEIHKIKNDLPLNSDKNIQPIVPQLNQAPQPQNIPELLQKITQQGGDEKKSPENVINNDKIEINEEKKEIKLSSSENIKAVENEINKLEQKSDKSNTDLIRKLDHDRNESTHKGGKHNHSSTSSDYNAETENIAVYSNSNSNGSKSGVFLQKNAPLKKTIPKYENIKI